MSSRKAPPHDTVDDAAPDPDGWLSADWIAKDLQVPIATFYAWRTNGKGPRGHKIGKYIRVRRRDYEAWLATLAEDFSLARA